MEQETRVELHRRSCSCRGGSWVLVGTASSSPCPSAKGDESPIVVPLTEWRTLGKPANAEDYEAATSRAAAGERREFERFAAVLVVQLSRVPTWKNQAPQREETLTEVIAKGGALVRSRMAVEKGDLLVFEAGQDGFRTRAEVMYVTLIPGTTADNVQRLGLRFIDAPFPEEMIPANAPPVP